MPTGWIKCLLKSRSKPMNISDVDFLPELSFHASRSGGKGGQNVNKVSTKIELEFNVESSSLLTGEQKAIIMDKLRNRMTAEGMLRIVSQAERSQLGNKKKAIEKFYDLLTRALKPRKKRVATKPSRAVKEKRLSEKKQHSEKKAMRKRDW
jgi:ribosome-associated protein